MNHLIFAKLGPDANLLAAPDSYLNHQKEILASKIEMYAGELDTILKVMSCKKAMADENMVAVNVQDGPETVMKVLPLRHAVKELSKTSKDDAEAQIRTWLSDGYDVAEAIRATG